MALIKCPECGNKVSDKANACPKCGYPNNKKETTDKDLSEEIAKLQKDLQNKNLQIMDLKNKSNNNSNSNRCDNIECEYLCIHSCGSEHGWNGYERIELINIEE